MEAVAQEDFESLVDLCEARISAHRFGRFRTVDAVKRRGNLQQAGSNHQKCLVKNFGSGLQGGDHERLR